MLTSRWRSSRVAKSCCARSTFLTNSGSLSIREVPSRWTSAAGRSENAASAMVSAFFTRRLTDDLDLLHAKEEHLAGLEKSEPVELLFEVTGALRQIFAPQVLGELGHAVNHLAGARDQHYQDPARGEANEVHVTEDAVAEVGADDEADHAGHVREQTRGAAHELRQSSVGWTNLLADQELVCRRKPLTVYERPDVETITAIRGHSSRPRRGAGRGIPSPRDPT